MGDEAGHPSGKGEFFCHAQRRFPLAPISQIGAGAGPTRSCPIGVKVWDGMNQVPSVGVIGWWVKSHFQLKGNSVGDGLRCRGY